jgi:NAD(P)-dependent dehydrogenase (short-subunit alcohol dehydrogenase family)
MTMTTTTDEMNGKIVMVTGATDGIGKESARALAGKGATVIVVSRNPQKCDATVAEIKDQTGNANVEAMPADLSWQHDVRELSSRFLDRYPRLDVLLNNAGAIFASRQLSKDGIEMTWALNHLNYFLLTHLLLDALKAAPAARVVNVSSGAHHMGRINFDDLEGEKRYSGWTAYGNSKLANVMFTYELARRLDGTRVTTNVLHPGSVGTSFGRNNGGVWNAALKLIGRFNLSPADGAKTSIYLASSPDVGGVTGNYFDNCKAVSSSNASYDAAVQKRLWDVSAAMCGVSVSQ